MSADTIEVEPLIDNVLTGSSSAFEQLIARETWVRGHVRVRVKHNIEVETVVQEIWRRIYKKLHTFDPKRGNFRAFALIWVTCALKEHFKALSPENQLPTEQQEAQQEAQEPTGDA